MFALIEIVFALARTKRGRRALKALFVYLNSEDGRRLLAQARRVATGPEAQRVAAQVVTVLRAAADRTRAARGRPAPPAGVAGRAWQRARSVRVRR
jgi:hypothetical protein